ncbi:hypothetical protein ACJX0J_018139, partial [Zea mays]
LTILYYRVDTGTMELWMPVVYFGNEALQFNILFLHLCLYWASFLAIELENTDMEG